MKALQYLNKFFIKYKWRLLLGIIITVLSKILSLKIPEIIKNSLNVVEDYVKGNTNNLENVKHELLINILLIVDWCKGSQHSS